MPETVTRLRATVTVDGYGDSSVDWATPDQLPILARGIEPVSSSEDNDGRQAVITGLRVYLPAGSDIRAGDRVAVRGSTWEVDGQPADWRSPMGSSLGGLVVALNQVTG